MTPPSEIDFTRLTQKRVMQRSNPRIRTPQRGGDHQRDHQNSYAELQAVSNFSFLHGASHPEEIVQTAAQLGYSAIALCDHNSVAGIVRAHQAAKECGITFIAGATLTVSAPKNGVIFSLLAHPISRKGYGNLTRMISIIKQLPTTEKPALPFEDFQELNEGIALTIIPPSFSMPETHGERQLFLRYLPFLVGGVREKALLSIAISKSSVNQEHDRLSFIHQLATRMQVPLLATNNILYHTDERRILQDVLHCTRIGKTIEEAGFELEQNSERFLKDKKEIYRIFQNEEVAIMRACEIAALCSNFSLDQLRYEYPNEVVPHGHTPKSYLENLTWQGAATRYPRGIPENIRKTINEELALIGELGYEKYFITCYDIVRFARSLDILCQGRGAAANSAVCYVLGITSVDPARIDLLFARFVSKERHEPPDIDIDFEHERREEVIQYIYRRYGREHAGLTCEVVTYQHRSAVRDVGKALGLSVDTVQKLAKSIHRWNDCQITENDLREIGFDPHSKTIHMTIALSHQLLSFPRHLSQHVGGFIISETPLCEMVPILNARMEDRTIIEWDKDDIEALGMLKIDILALGMLTCIRKALTLVNQRRAGQEPLSLHTIPAEDGPVYDMICDADTVGVFQIESRAQMSMLPRLRPRTFYDLVIEVAIVRPGPIQGNMVHPYLKRRAGKEKIIYPDKRVEEILHKTLGVPLFQEQAMRLAIALAHFTPGEAEQLRRAIAAWKRNKEVIATFTQRVIEGMTESGYAREFAESCMQQIKGFSEYGFPESHAASFALLVYVSAWLKRYYPGEFAAALLNSQPMGFYAPAQIIRDLKNPTHTGRTPVEALPIDINRSDWDCAIEEVHNQDGTSLQALRIGLRLVRGINEHEGKKLAQFVREHGPFSSIQKLWQKLHAAQIGVRKSTLLTLARADAFHSIDNISRHQAVWQVRGLADAPLLRACPTRTTIELPRLDTQESMFKDYEKTGFSLRAHPLECIREDLTVRGVKTARQLREMPLATARTHIRVAGLAIIRQRPGTAKGMVFLTLEDETGIVNLMVRPAVYEKYRSIIVSSSVLFAAGVLEKVSSVIYIQTVVLESLDSIIKSTVPNLFPSRSYSY